MNKKLPVYELDLDDINFDAITAISLVDMPAIERNFMAFNKQVANFQFATQDNEKRIVTGPALIPDKLIYRRNGDYEFDIFFSQEAIEKISIQFMSEYKQKNVTLQHESNVNDVVVIESWLITDPENDKSKALGFDSLPAGTWMVSMKINNDTVWDLIKDGSVRGFSIEAYLTQTLIKAGKIKSQDEQILDQIIEILKNIE